MHFPALEELCGIAELRGLQPRLAVGTTMRRAGRGEGYRLLARLELWQHRGQQCAAAQIHDGDIEAAALDLLKRLATTEGKG